MAPHLARIRVYPVKSLDGYELSQANVIGGAGLAGDREFALCDEAGNLATAKRFGERILRLRARFSENGRVITLTDAGESAEYSLDDGAAKVAAWFSERLGEPLVLKRNSRTGFPDDEAATGPTVISTATVETVAGWFSLSPEEVRRRFRANLEIAGVGPFEEDRLFGGAQSGNQFRIGEVDFTAVNPCARCSVPGRDSLTGEIFDATFARKFSELREQQIPTGVDHSRFDHYYRLAVNTTIATNQSGKRLTTGDPLTQVS